MPRPIKPTASDSPVEPADIPDPPPASPGGVLERRPPIPAVYDSAAKCSATTGIPLQVLRRSSKADCPAIRSGRVYLKEFLTWVFTQDPETSGVDWGTELKKEQALRVRQRRLTEDDKLIPIEIVEAGRAIFVQTFCAEWLRLIRDAPASLKGMDEEQIRAWLQKHYDKIEPRLKETCEAIGKSKGES